MSCSKVKVYIVDPQKRRGRKKLNSGSEWPSELEFPDGTDGLRALADWLDQLIEQHPMLEPSRGDYGSLHGVKVEFNGRQELPKLIRGNGSSLSSRRGR